MRPVGRAGLMTDCKMRRYWKRGREHRAVSVHAGAELSEHPTVNLPVSAAFIRHEPRKIEFHGRTRVLEVTPLGSIASFCVNGFLWITSLQLGEEKGWTIRAWTLHLLHLLLLQQQQTLNLLPVAICRGRWESRASAAVRVWHSWLLPLRTRVGQVPRVLLTNLPHSTKKASEGGVG